MRCFAFTSLFLFFFWSLPAQQNLRLPSTGFSGPMIVEPVRISTDSARQIIINKSFLPLGQKGIWQIQKQKEESRHQWYFYYLILLVVFFALLKQLYPRYLQDLFRVFLRTSLKANQIKEQLVASVWQSFLFNIMFFLSGGFYLFLLLKYDHDSPADSDATRLALCTGLLAGLYITKMLFLRMSGWLLNVSQPAETYIFIVFLINKVMGILFLPLTIMIAFAPAELADFSIRFSFLLIAALFFYRSLLGLQAGNSISKLSKFHFLLYILSVEIIPLLAIFRVFLNIF